MSFGSPLMLLGLLAVLAPIVIHLINRQRAKRVQFPALEFLLKSQKKLARRLKVKQLALLAMRIGFFVLVPLAMAQPSVFCGGEETSEIDGRLPASVVIVVDDSGSMSAPDGDGTLYDTAVDQARAAVRELRSWDQVSVVFASDSADVAVGELSDDRGLVRDALSAHEPRFAQSDVRGALIAAREIQETSRLPARRTVFFTDHTDGGWPALADLPVAGLGVLDVRQLGEPTPSNVAITDVSYERADTGGDDIVVHVTVRGWGLAADETRSVAVELSVDGAPVGAGSLDVGEAAASTSFVHSVDTQNAVTLQVALEGDTGPAVDDVWTIPYLPDRAIRTLLINGDARSVALNDELFFLQRALSLTLDDQREIETAVTSPEELVGEDLDTFDVVILANVAALPVPQVDRLVAFVEAGGGLWMSAGDNVNAERWNSLFSALLPKPVRDVKVLASRGHTDASIQATRIGELDRLHPAVRVFGERGGESLRSALVYQYLLLEPTADSDALVLASFADGGPALLERSLGRGRVMLWTATLDDGWTDLPLATTYLPLVRRVVQYLARRGGGVSTSAVRGQSHVLDVGSLRPERVIVTPPSERREVLTAEGDEVVYQVVEAGVHRVSVATGADELAMPSLDFAVNANAAEFPVAALPDERVAALESATMAAASTGETGTRPEGRSLWPLLLFLGLCALYAETLLSLRRRLWVQLGERIGVRKPGESL